MDALLRSREDSDAAPRPRLPFEVRKIADAILRKVYFLEKFEDRSPGQLQDELPDAFAQLDFYDFNGAMGYSRHRMHSVVRVVVGMAWTEFQARAAAAVTARS